jgi:predicted permease
MVQGRMYVPLLTEPGFPERLRQAPPLPAPGSPNPPNLLDVRHVSSDFLRAMGVRLIEGRGFTDGDREGAPPVVLINKALARSGLLGGEAIGKTIYMPPDVPWEVVGIVDDVRQFALDQEPGAQVFINSRQLPAPPPPDAGGPYFALRTIGEPLAIIEGVRASLRHLDPDATIDNVATMEDVVSNSLSRPRLYTVLLSIFATMAVLLAAIGIYGVTTYSVTQRTREIGVRIALGAEPANVVRLVLRQCVVLTTTGIVLGIAGAAAVTRYLKGMLFGITPLDPATFLVVVLVFGAVALLASYLPARRATKVDPLIALRCN